MSTPRRARGTRSPLSRVVAATTAAILALTGAVLVDTAATAPASASQLPQCPAPGQMPGVGNVPAFTDSNVAVYVGGDFSATGAAAESEGLLVVMGDATFQKASQGVYNVGTAGAGSQITPPGGTTMLAVGARLTVGSTTKLHVGMNVDGGGNVDVGGTVTSTHPIDTNGGAVRPGLGAEAVAPYGDFGRVVRQQSADLAAAHPTPARIERSGKKVSFAADASASLHTFTVEASALTSLGTKVEVDFTGVGPDAPIVVNVTGADATIDLGTVRFDGTQVNGLSSPGIGNASSRILWNFVDARTVTIGQNDHFLGTVLAPFADATLSTSTSGRLYVGGDLRVVGNGIEHHNYPWIGPGAFACVPENTGTFTVTKRVVGDAESRVPDATSFTVGYSYTDGGAQVTGDLVVAADGRLVSGPAHLTTGTVVTLSEPTLPTIPGVAWGTPSFSPSDEITIGEGGSVAVTLTNTARVQQGGFSVGKAIDGDAADLVPAGTEFTVAYSYELAGAPTSGTLRVGADGTVQAGPQDLPVGSVVTFSETDLPTVPGVVWGAPVFTVDGKPVTSVTIGDGGNPTVTVTNTAHPVVAPVGGFSMKKVVTGAAAGLVPAGTQFSVSYSYEVDGAPTSGTVTVGADGALVAGPQNLREGTLVTFAELAPPTVDGVVWAAPVLTVDGKPATSLVIGDGSNPAVTVTNGADPAATPVGGFSVRKAVTGEAAGLVPAGTRFTVAYSYEVDGTPTSGTLLVRADGTVEDGPQNLPAGTAVTFGEVDLPSIDGVVWGAPTFSVGGRPTTSVTVGEGSNQTVTLTNTASDEPAGGFSVRKSVTGEAAGQVPASARFTVAYSYDLDGVPTSGRLTVGADGSVQEGPQNLPVGTVVSFQEEALPSLDGVVWDAPVFSPASIVIGDGTNPVVALTNTASDEPAGGFSVRKAVTGTAADLVPAGTTFTVAYSYDLAGATTSGTLAVRADGTVVDGPQNLPVGTVVTLRELAPPTVDGVVWGAPVLTVGGRPTTSVTVGDGGNPTVTVTNTANAVVVPTGGFSVRKSLAGDAADLVPAGTRFTVAYSYELAGATASGTLTVGADGAVTTGLQNLREGTRVTFGEVDLPSVDGVVWGAPAYSVGGQPVTSLVIGDGTNPVVALTNTASDEPAGGFSVRKAVTGTAADLVPAGTTFTVAYSYDLAGATTSGTLAVRADGTVVDGPQNLPVGTVVTLRELAPPTVDGVVWGAPVLTVGGRPTTSVTVGDGGNPTVTVTNTANAVVVPTGGFSMAKAFRGAAAAAVPTGTEFAATYEYTIDGVTTGGTLRLSGDGTVVDGPQHLVAGTVVRFGELTPPEVVGVAWGTPVFSVAGTPVTSITIGDGANPTVTLTNTADVAVGTFSIAKVVQGDGAALVPAGTAYTVEYAYGLGAQTVTGTLAGLTVGAPVSFPGNLVEGTVVELREVDLPDVEGVVWGTPVLSHDRVVVGRDRTVEVTLTNTAGRAPAGGFALVKDVVGETADRVPADSEFTVVYAYDLGGTSTTGALTVAADGTVVDGPQNLPVGTVVTFAEVDLPAVDGVVWGAPVFSPASVTIADGGSPTVTLTNTAGAEPAGGFSIRKVVAGSGAQGVPPRSPFTVAYSYGLDAQVVTGTVQVLADGTVVDGPQDLPVGTVVSFSEVDLPAVAGVVWGPPVFSPATVTITEGESTTVTLTNTADVVAAQVGGLTVAKAVVGPNAAKVPDGTEFTVAFSATVDGERTEGTLRLRADGTVVEGPANLPAGTVVELEEVDLPDVDGVVWGTPVFMVDGEDVTSVTIGPGEVVDVTLVNTAGAGLAVTGSGAVGIAATALLLVGGGALLLVGARRRRA
ncbi:choice-of-anchor A family protein [Oerskovia sp. Sa1BUA8]|uniref:Choice-of-anchor A family protein n=1 Tax=Oerskovia douganii TaxID=2762210 RepID=A0A9D5UCH1_9CELL|nr:DUF5979 domain-containing protein [Oerskovia douganii]MBE7700491.1 choice-of-anchor A family protein [Oerskovia douganii]